MAAIHTVNLVDASLAADFTGFRLDQHSAASELSSAVPASRHDDVRSFESVDCCHPVNSRVFTPC
ncbi:hypothetical protein ACIQB5_13935 [Streptomyces sp. NPDC088560]|uniref:hypothetical protein n=1 Tax=Streptomyces sp. NPDC088560 TaxID=3365868 RepID=UPI0037FE1129